MSIGEEADADIMAMIQMEDEEDLQIEEMAVVGDDPGAVYDVILPDTDASLRAQGRRLRITRDTNVALYAVISDEQTLPECVEKLNANVVEVLDEIALDAAQVRWLRDQLSELLVAMEGGS